MMTQHKLDVEEVLNYDANQLVDLFRISSLAHRFAG